MDLKNTKIWIGDNPELSKQVQEIAFELGYTWPNCIKTFQHTRAKALFFTGFSKFIQIVSDISRWGFDDDEYTEITPEQLGITLLPYNPTDIKVGQRCWNIQTNEYFGKIEKIVSILEYDTVAAISDKEPIFPTRFLTNKVVVECKTKKEFEFMLRQLNKTSKYSFEDFVANNKTAYVGVNFSDSNFRMCEGWLSLTVDKYMQGIGETPLLTTEDGIDKYVGMEMGWFIVDNALKYSNQLLTKDDNILPKYYKFFDTEQAGKKWIQNNTKAPTHESHSLNLSILCTNSEEFELCKKILNNDKFDRFNPNFPYVLVDEQMISHLDYVQKHNYNVLTLGKYCELKHIKIK